MSKSKKNTKNNSSQKQNDTQNYENNMNYATDKQSGNATDCHDNQSQNKNESNCQ